MSINNVTLLGRLTYSPELRSTPSGVSVIRFQIAVDRKYQADPSNRQADFIDCIAWRQTAEFINRYFHKGSMIALEGSIQTSNYTDKNGVKRKQTEVVADNVSFCGSKSDNGAAGQQNAPNLDVTAAEFEEIVDDDDDLPF